MLEDGRAELATDSRIFSSTDIENEDSFILQSPWVASGGKDDGADGLGSLGASSGAFERLVRDENSQPTCA